MRRAYCTGAAVWMNYLLWEDVDLARWQTGRTSAEG
jgi:hypothetical protein